MNRPEKTEYAPYFNQYVELVQDADFIGALEREQEKTQALLATLSEEQGNLRYAAGKWSVKELLIHIIDTERVFCYRALSFARGHKAPLPGFDHDAFAVNCRSDNRKLYEIANEFKAVRLATVALFRSFDSEALVATGTANGNPFTVGAIGYITVGHEMHHRNVLKNKYL